jgi:hypothetical protein
MILVFFVFPDHAEIVDHQSETDRARLIPEYRWCARKLKIATLLQMLKQSLLAQGPSLGQPIMGFVYGTK